MLDLGLEVDVNDGSGVSKREKRLWTAARVVGTFLTVAMLLLVFLALWRIADGLDRNGSLMERVVCQRDGIPESGCAPFVDSLLARPVR